MKAVVYKEPCTVAVENVDDPRIENPRDAIVKITSAAICGSDLHMYEGRTGAKPGTVFGHENMGVVEEIGPGVTSLKVGDRVVLPFNIACGFCFNCLRGFTSACLTVNAAAPHAAYGYADMGPFKGGQAEYLRVPYADFNALKLPGQPGDQWEDDFVMLADIWPTGLSRRRTGRRAAGWDGRRLRRGAGGPDGRPEFARSKAPARSTASTAMPGRLKLAEQAGAIPINFSAGRPGRADQGDAPEERGWRGALRPGEEKMDGVMHGVDAVGYQARDEQDPSKENPMQVFDDLIRVVNPTGTIGMVGVYMPKIPVASTGRPSRASSRSPGARSSTRG